MEYGRLFDVLGAVRGRLFRSVTPNGLSPTDPALRRYMPVAAPKYPPMLDQLPPDLAAEAARVRIPFVRFADVTCVQPLEQVPWNT